MSKQLILCVETSIKSKNDYIYLKELISHLYVLDNKIKLSPVYMNGKFNYNHKKVESEISKLTKMYKPNGETSVIYVFDKDRHTFKYVDAKFIENTSGYCEKHGYDVIWFVETIEQVFIGKKIRQSEKTDTAAAFKKKSLIKTISIPSLSVKDPKKSKTSNALLVLDKHLSRKQ